MLNNSDLIQLIAMVLFIAIETVCLMVIIRLCQRPPLDPTGSIRDVGFIGRFGVPLGGVICFGVLFALTAVAIVPGGFLVSFIGWWVVSLKLFGLTVRQTLKANVALGLLNVAVMVAIGAL